MKLQIQVYSGTVESAHQSDHVSDREEDAKTCAHAGKETTIPSAQETR